MTRKLLLAGALAAIATPLIAQSAAPAPQPVRPPLAQSPAPLARAPMAERVLLRSEVDAQVRTHFARMDTNRDGFVTREEAMHGAGGHRIMIHKAPGAPGAAGAPGAMMHGDADGHGNRVVRIERRVDGQPGAMPPHVEIHRMGGGAPDANPGAAFDRLDANRDGQISRDEFAKGRVVRIEKRVAERGGKPMRRMHQMRAGRGGLVAGAVIRMVDTDKDGRISLAEATSGTLQHFDRIDTNRDGRLTPDERRSGRIMIREMREQRRGG